MMSILKRNRQRILVVLAFLECLGGTLLILMGQARVVGHVKHLAIPEMLSGTILIVAGSYLLYRVLFSESTPSSRE